MDAMEEYDEPSDVEMVPLEQAERVRATLRPEELQVIETNDVNKYV